MSIERRTENRRMQSELNNGMKNVEIDTGAICFRCIVCDAGNRGLGLIAGEEYHKYVIVGKKIRINFDGFHLDAEVLNTYQSNGGNKLRFGVFLFKERQLGPYHRLFIQCE